MDLNPSLTNGELSQVVRHGLNRFLKYWRLQEKGKYRAKIVAYADDFVILSRGYAEQPRDWTQTVMSRIGLSVNEQKTSIRNARAEDFDFLGYTFGPRWWWKNGRKYTPPDLRRRVLSGYGRAFTICCVPVSVTLGKMSVTNSTRSWLVGRTTSTMVRWRRRIRR